MWQLGDVPPGLQFDEAHNALDAARVLAGARDVFFTDNGGREPLSIYLSAPALALLGGDRAALALRLVSALAGLATIGAVYACVRAVFRDRGLAAVTSAYLAVSYWHVHFSRYGIRAVLAPLWTTLAVGAWWRALEAPAEGRGGRAGVLLPAVLAGLAMAAAVYSHPTGRLVPLILVGHAVYRTLAERAGARRVWTALAVAGGTAFVAFLPLGAWLWRHPEWFTGHPSDVSIYAVAARDYGGSVARALAAQAAAIGGMFFLAGDPSTFHNLPGLPVFDPLSALLAVVGAGLAAAALLGADDERRDRAVLFALWLIVMLLPTLLSDRPPNYSRAIAALPVIVLLPALGLRWIVATLDMRWTTAARPGLAARTRGALAAGAIAVAGVWTAWHYGVVFAQRTPHVYYSYDVEKRDAYQALVDLSAAADVFLHPLWAEHATIAFLNRAGPIRMLDARDTLVLPPGGRDVVVAFPAKEAEREGWAGSFEARFGPVAGRRDIADALGAPLLVTYRVPAAARGDLEPPTDAALEPAQWTAARFSGVMDLAGYTVGAARPGEPLPITLVWRSILPTPHDLTTFVHLVGPGGEPLGQLDRQPAHASYPTSRWRPDEVIVDHFEPVLAEDASGPVTIQVGWYDAATGRRLEVGDDTVFRLKPVAVEPR